MIRNVRVRATLLGLLAPMGWGMSVGLVRTVTSTFGLAAGMALLYCIALLFVLVLFGRPRMALFPKKYLFFGIPLANLSNLLFAVSMHFCQDSEQTVEVGMVNYLWPCLVILLAVLFNGQKARWWVFPGMLVSFVGIMLVLGGQNGIDPGRIFTHVQQNPLSYGLAFLGALAWGAYSNATRAWSNGQNPWVLIFAGDFLVFGVLWLMGYGDFSQAHPIGWISIVLGGLVMGGSYAVWSYGMYRGHITLLAIASYFTPVLSCLFAAVWIGAELDSSLWIGVLILVAGSLLCWSATLTAFNHASLRT